jgi:hypothetical protein
MSTKPPEILDRIVDKVLAYRPRPKSKPGKKRKRLAAKIAKERIANETRGIRESD